MMRASAAASIALFLADACGVAAALPPDRIFERVAPSVWSVHAFGADGKPLASASGLAVAPGHLVTSCRTLARASRVELRQGTRVHDAKLEFPDVERDLCQLRAPDLTAPALARASARTLRPGQRVYVIGFSLGSEASIAEGLISAVRDAGATNERIQTTVPAAGGLLGAGVFDEEARLVGVVTSSPANAPATAFAVPADWLAELAARGQAALATRAAGAAKAKAAASREGMPAAGSQWVYGFIDRQYRRRQINVTVRAMRVDGTSVDEAVTSGNPGAQETQRTVSAGESRFVTHRLTDDAELVEFAPYFLAANGEKAATITIRTAGYPAGHGNPAWGTESKLPIWEQVTVPAGTFRALRLEFGGRRIATPIVSNQFLVRVWYAPEVGRYVKLERMEWLIRGQASHDVVELMKFSPPP